VHVQLDELFFRLKCSGGCSNAKASSSTNKVDVIWIGIVGRLTMKTRNEAAPRTSCRGLSGGWQTTADGDDADQRIEDNAAVRVH
jgi:hypothetical protein